MKSIMLIHNGDYKNRNPFWTVRLWPDGVARGEVIGPRSTYSAMQSFEKHLPEDLAIALFALPRDLVGREIATQPDKNEAIVHFTENGCAKGVFLVSELAIESPYRRILETTVDFVMKENTEHGAAPAVAGAPSGER